uniref:Calcineurin-like phosphoesterase n=1 Tax=Candidatus Kentrum sp. FM TaxID=2126340 RepID=A0A450T0M9_9GAMM|nr:MAG: Calcineurin-like phosphoesterase [Candidatus Kentron sp. FM]VFJ60037.1 MAG: Calcineurin-like phosphoesterase [Candidatus Kentron sp. FM]VFK13211.1 MAG: Calcineurin-like phosphoesterase [Candidatus Kentron sp. FM]
MAKRCSCSCISIQPSVTSRKFRPIDDEQSAMERLIWITDPHLDFLEDGGIDGFVGEMADIGRGGVVVITGDIATAKNLDRTLDIIHKTVPRVFFVLGNHDAYGGSIAGVREIAGRFPGYLTARTEPVPLSPTTYLVGHDGWADGRAGDYYASPVMLNDYVHIKELAGLSRQERFRQLNALGDEASAAVRTSLSRALATCQHVVLATHVPPFQDACWHEGETADDDWAPHFSSRIMGEILMETMADHPDKRLTVLCGHTHSPGVHQPMDNIMVYTGGAAYGQPMIQGVFEVGRMARFDGSLPLDFR